MMGRDQNWAIGPTTCQRPLPGPKAQKPVSEAKPDVCALNDGEAYCTVDDLYCQICKAGQLTSIEICSKEWLQLNTIYIDLFISNLYELFVQLVLLKFTLKKRQMWFVALCCSKSV